MKKNKKFIGAFIIYGLLTFGLIKNVFLADFKDLFLDQPFAIILIIVIWAGFSVGLLANFVKENEG